MTETPPAGDGPPPHRRVSRRTFLGLGAVVGTAAVLGGVEVLRTEDTPAPDESTPAQQSAFMPVVRWSLEHGDEGWTASGGTPASAAGADPDGWFRASGTGQVAVTSAAAPLLRPMDWTLTDRDTARRLSVTVRVDGQEPEYDVVVTMCWQTDGSVNTIDSATFTVPANLAVDLDTWWDCRQTAPPDVLTKVQGIKVRAAGEGDFTLYVRNVRQPATTAQRGGMTGMASAFFATAPPTLPQPEPADAYQRAVLRTLDNVADWGSRSHRAIHIGEWAWPKESRTTGPTDSDRSYADLAEQWMRLADLRAIPFTPWGESGYWSGSLRNSQANYGSYPDANYFCSGTPQPDPGSAAIVNALKPSASILEEHLARVPGRPASINLVGMCFTYLKDGTQYSATNIGKRGSDYFAENPDSVAYLHSRGYRMFRLPFRWDRVMRSPDDAQLDGEEWGYVEAAVDTILSLPGTSVIVDQHSSAQFWMSPEPSDRTVPATKYTVDDPSGRVTTDHMVHFWELVSDRLRDRSDRLVYEITNEPKDSSPHIVRRYTQAVVSSLRSRGDNTFCLIPSHPFDNAVAAIEPENHPFPWIDDPAGTRQHAYTIHHYMDYDRSGGYKLTYAETLAKYS